MASNLREWYRMWLEWDLLSERHCFERWGGPFLRWVAFQARTSEVDCDASWLTCLREICGIERNRFATTAISALFHIYIYTSVTKISTQTNTPTEQRNSEPYLGASCPLRTHIRLCHISLRHFESNKEIWHGWPVTSLCSFYVCRREGIYTLTHL